MRNVRNHNKRVHPTKYSVPLSAWDECKPTFVNELPYDIDGLAVYTLKINQDDKMGSTADGRNWSSWASSSRKGFKKVPLE